jgi:Ca2+-binding EF-hand superfamily protein
MKKFLAAAAIALTGTTTFAQTAPVAPPPPPAPMAHPMSDKVMTRAETVAMVRDHFGRLDSDRDGAITTAEVIERHGEMHDGDDPHVMRHHKVRDPGAAFDRFDANKDGSISREEFAEAREHRIEKRIVIKEQRRDKRREFRKHRMGGIGGARMIVMADTDKDGRITLAEAEAMALRHFDQMDANRDGQVTPEERRAGRPMIIKKAIEEKNSDS